MSLKEFENLFNRLIQLPQETFERNKYNKIVEYLVTSFQGKCFNYSWNPSESTNLDELFDILKTNTLSEYDYIAGKIANKTDQRAIRRRILGRELGMY